MKKMFVIFYFCLFFIPFCVNADFIESDVDLSLKVYDYANLLDESEERLLHKKATAYIDKTNFDMVIVTISNNERGSAANFASDFYDYNNFGFDDEYSGILYLIDMDNREVFIDVSGKAIDVYNDSTLDSMLDEIYEDVSNEDYYESCVSFINDASDNFSNIDVRENKVNWGLSFIVALGVPTLIVSVMISSHKTIKLAGAANDYINRKDTKIGVAKDTFLTKNIAKVCIQTHSSSGGSTTRVGSSGRVHGGRGRKF